jgi:hypothetical protein
LTLRADSGFWSSKTLAACRRHHIRFSVTVRQTATVAAAIAAIGEAAWVDIHYPDGGIAQVAETTLGPDRLIVRRTRLTGPQATLWPDWRHHAFVTNRVGSAIDLDVDHRRHAVCELAIRDLKHGAGLRHCPSGVFLANAAWLVIATQAHNLLRWVATIGLGSADLVIAKTLRRRLLHLPGRLTRSARRCRLHLPNRLAVGHPVPSRVDPPASHPTARLTPSSQLDDQPAHRPRVSLQSVRPSAWSVLLDGPSHHSCPRPISHANPDRPPTGASRLVNRAAVDPG